MFRRIDVLSDVLHEEQQVVEAAAMAKLQRKKNKRLELGTLERLAQTTCELNKLVERLRTSCHEGEGARLRDACCSLIQILAAYHANPDLGWLGVNASYWKVEGEIIRSYVRSQGMQTFARREANGTLNLLGNETVSLCRPEILAGVAAALVDITPLFRRSVESEELIEALSEERRLVLVDLRPRRVYWDGVQIDQDWDINQKSWELLWALAERAQKSQPLDAEDLAEMNQEGSPVKHRRRRLKLLLDEALDNKIKPVPPKGYRLDLKPSELAMLQIKDQFGLVEVGIDQLPPITVGSAI
jgi:hypothetical protein